MRNWHSFIGKIVLLKITANISERRICFCGKEKEYEMKRKKTEFGRFSIDL